MKKYLFTPILLLSTNIFAAGCGFDETTEKGVKESISTCTYDVMAVEPVKKETILTGNLDVTQILALDVMQSEYASYEVDMDAIIPLQKLEYPIEITVIIGTWCPDCHRETPRFIKILEKINNPNIAVSFIGVDRTKNDPKGLSSAYDFKKIPTFIVSKMDNKGSITEIGRIVEMPNVSLEKDLADIIK